MSYRPARYDPGLRRRRGSVKVFLQVPPASVGVIRSGRAGGGYALSGVVLSGCRPLGGKAGGVVYVGYRADAR
jgi:hypothetical protein